MKTKKSKGTNFMGEVFGWTFLIGIFAGIWIPQFRWRLIFTAAFCLFLAIVLASYIKSKEEKHGK